MTCIIIRLLVLAAVMLLCSEAYVAGQCSPHNITDYQQFTPEERWHFDQNPCGFRALQAEELSTLLKGKSILFIGDSSVRNSGLALLAAMCNPEHMSKCDQIMTLPFIRRDQDIVSAFSCMEDSPSNRCAEIKHRFTPIANLTANEFYKTQEERRKFWKSKTIPPLLSMHFRDTEFHILEAGCSNHRDGLWLILDHLLKFNVPFRYDMIVLSGGLHCSYRLYKGGTWYRSLFERFKYFRSAGIPLIWIEVTHCLKNDGGHYFKLEGKWTLNYRKLAACPFIDKHIPFMKSGALRNGAAFVHTRHITQNLSLLGKAKTDKSYKFNEAQRNDPCPFMDPIHPTVECYGAIAQSMAHTIKQVVENATNFVSLEPQPSKITLQEEGTVTFGDSFVVKRHGKQHDGGGREALMTDGSDVDDVMHRYSKGIGLVVVGIAVYGVVTFNRRRRRAARAL